jgi:8-oxo-dGTP pyrophosphatase MutT (NUDIX family)
MTYLNKIARTMKTYKEVAETATINNCNNCGKRGHNFHQCKLPIISNGIIAFRFNPNGQKEYLMIRRKDTLGFIDFVRGKYSVNNSYYISNMICQMTCVEKEMLLKCEFDELLKCVWGDKCNLNGIEECAARDKFNQLRNGICMKNDKYTLADLVTQDKTHWEEPEWGFPKGRRDNNETDLGCAIREFCEETGYELPGALIENVLPFEETFIGSNYKSYKHKYFLMKMDYEYSKQVCLENIKNNFEISAIRWMPFLECVNTIRAYNLEKRKIVICVNTILTRYMCL